jgi:hypothetical protein
MWRRGIDLRAVRRQRRRPPGLRRLAAAGALVALISCGGGLPGNFASLPLDAKVRAYAKHLANFGRPRLDARAGISWHGWQAADLMAASLDAKRGAERLPASEALRIIHDVQVRGCNLRGKPAEGAVERFLAREPADSADAVLARITLRAIRASLTLPSGPDTLRGGPCKEPQAAPRAAVQHSKY